MYTKYVDEDSLRFLIIYSRREIICQLMFIIQNLTWMYWSQYLKLSYTRSEKKREVGEPWLDIHKTKIRII